MHTCYCNVTIAIIALYALLNEKYMSSEIEQELCTLRSVHTRYTHKTLMSLLS